MKMRKLVLLALATAGLALAALPMPAAHANDFDKQMRAYYDAKIKPLLADPEVVAFVKAQNAKHADLDAAKIDVLDKQWRAEAKAGGKGPLVEDLLGRPLSAKLKAFKQSSGGMVVELFLMDNKGLNVAQADITSDYMQGDEAKWQKTFQIGPSAVFVDDVDFDESSKAFIAQISGTIVDPADGKPIGAVTVGLAVEKLP
jgi:hypothetical protein